MTLYYIWCISGLKELRNKSLMGIEPVPVKLVLLVHLVVDPTNQFIIAQNSVQLNDIAVRQS
jgi:hypothetical protein